MATKQKAVEERDALTVFEQVSAVAKKGVLKKRVIKAMEIGEHIRQGDVYLTRAAKIPAGLKEIQDRQLAPGTSQGSRHVIAGKCKVFGRENRDTLTGPVIEATGTVTLEHPEHAHFELPKGVYEVSFQEDQQTRQRVQD